MKETYTVAGAFAPATVCDGEFVEPEDPDSDSTDSEDLN